MENTSIKNEQHFNFLKQNFPNLENINFKNNYLIYTENNVSTICFLGAIDLASIENSLFSLSPKEFMYILTNISLMVNNPQDLNKKIRYVDILLDFPSLEKEHITYIYNYINDFYLRKNMHNKFAYDGDLFEIEKMAMPIHKCYDDKLESFHNPGATYIRNLEEEYHNNALQGNNSNQVEKAFVRELKSSHRISVEEPQYINIAGFMNASLIISVVSSIGLVLAVILYAINQ